MGKRAFIDKKLASHFHVVHRSQRDPTLADDTQSKYVLKPVLASANHLKHGLVPPSPHEFYGDSDSEEASGDGHGESEVPGQESESEPDNANIDETRGGEAISYGVYFDDQDEYDYMQHLKPMGDDPSAVFVAAPNAQKAADAAQRRGGIVFRDKPSDAAEAPQAPKSVRFALPASALAPQAEEAVGMLAKRSDTAWDLPPEYREALYALDDDAYLASEASGGDDDFFAALNAPEVPEKYRAQVEAGEAEWAELAGSSENEDEDSAVGSVGSEESAQTRRTARSSAPRTNFSMTSSAMFRNAHLTLLDDQFDRVLAEYDESEESDESDEDEAPELAPASGNAVDESVPALVGGRIVHGSLAVAPSEQQLDRMLETFLCTKDIVGKDMLSRENMVLGSRDFERYRAELRGGLSRDDIARRGDELQAEADAAEAAETANPDDPDGIRALEEHPFFAGRFGSKADSSAERWDCASIVSTYSNVYNRPAVIAAPTRKATGVSSRLTGEPAAGDDTEKARRGGRRRGLRRAPGPRIHRGIR